MFRGAVLAVALAACGPRVAPAPPPEEPREAPPVPPPEEPPVAEPAREPPIPPAQQARRQKEDEILAELERRKAPLMQVPWKPIALERSTKWAGVQYVRFEPAYEPTNIGPLVVATFNVELRGSPKGVEAVFQGLSIEAQPGEVRELTVNRDPSDGNYLARFRAILYARDPEMRGADEQRLAEAWKRAQGLSSGIRARPWLVAVATVGLDSIDSVELREGKVSYALFGKEGAGEAMAQQLAASPELAEVKFVGGMAEGKGKAKRTRLIIEAKLK